MSDDEDIAALVVDNGSGMCKGTIHDDATILEQKQEERRQPSKNLSIIGTNALLLVLVYSRFRRR
jgi:hypothetical protein